MTDQAGKFARVVVNENGRGYDVEVCFPPSGLRTITTYPFPDNAQDAVDKLNYVSEIVVTEAVAKERARCCRIVTGMCESDNEATALVKVIREGEDY